MTGQQAELLPVEAADDDGELWLCGFCRAPYAVKSLAGECADHHAALLESVPVFYGPGNEPSKE